MLDNLIHAIFGCRACLEKERQIVYLQKLADTLLLSRGVNPILVEPAKDEPDELETELNGIREKGGIVYGGD